MCKIKKVDFRDIKWKIFTHTDLISGQGGAGGFGREICRKI